VIVGEEAHVTVLRALRLLGLPRRARGRRRRSGTDAGRRAGDSDNSGASDPFAEIVAITRARGAWVHVDGAFGLWAAASPELSQQVAGVETADSWATHSHSWATDSDGVPADERVEFECRRVAKRYVFRRRLGMPQASRGSSLQGNC
jgi:hypothetical protein